MKSIDIKTTNVNKFNKKIKKNKFVKFPIFSVIEFNLHGSCNRRCAFCPRVDENLWPNIDEEFRFELFRKIIKDLKNSMKNKAIKNVFLFHSKKLEET